MRHIIIYKLYHLQISRKNLKLLYFNNGSPIIVKKQFCIKILFYHNFNPLSALVFPFLKVHPCSQVNVFAENFQENSFADRWFLCLDKTPHCLSLLLLVIYYIVVLSTSAILFPCIITLTLMYFPIAKTPKYTFE